MPLFTDERNSKITSVVNFISIKFESLPQGVLKVGTTNRVPTSTQIHPRPPSYIHVHPVLSISSQFISTSTQLHSPPPSSFQSPPSSLQHPQQYSNQNITRNWAISATLGQKIQSCPFLLKIGSQRIYAFKSRPPQSIFGRIWAQIVKVVCFVSHMVSPGC